MGVDAGKDLFNCRTGSCSLKYPLKYIKLVFFVDLENSDHVLRDEYIEIEQAVTRFAPYLPAYTLSSYRAKLRNLEMNMKKETFGNVPLNILKQTTAIQYSNPTVVSMNMDNETECFISNRTDEEVSIPEVKPSITLKNLKGCKVKCAPVHSSVFIEGCEDCEIEAAGQQIRMSGSKGCKLKVFTSTGVYIEDSEDYLVEELTLPLERLDEAGFARKQNKWNQVYDFNQ